ncbi:GNAT family N-acetyltransferase [Paraclostridium sordellii]|uniref:GNAT family N-acetyltransferase n=1 Tax=Paraclostridium sordellii TaxID=1505 RepID=UPI001F064B81|nr:GNAT family N-acetyltransferase [Paeniclostridium sordellii]MCH1966713.1 GNAT family N-acetyltransferase [Paeniclostridium sordellii]
MCTIKQFNDLTLEEFYEIAKSRYEIFACEQKIFTENDFDDIDKNCYHAFIKDKNLIVAYARIIPKEFSPYCNSSIGRVLVLKSYRKNHLAKKLMNCSIDFIKNEFCESHITISAQEYIKGLYSSLGFKEISNVYDECNIPHIKMRLDI